MKKVEKSGQITVRGKSISGRVDYGYCPLCLYASQNHWTLNNHVWLHFHVTMACRMLNCWYMSHSAESMWKHTASHGLHTAEPIAVNPKRSSTGPYPYFPTGSCQFLQPAMAATNITMGPSLGFPEEV